MENRASSWMVWAGLALSVVAFLSYPTFFVRFPITRDVPWANLVLFAVSLGLVIAGARRAFLPEGTRGKKIGAAIGGTLTVGIVVLFLVAVLVVGRQLPASNGAPHVGQKAPEFQLPDASGKPVSLSQLLAAPVNGRPPKGVLLVFYRGYW